MFPSKRKCRAPGNSIGQLTVGNDVIWNSDGTAASTWEFELGGSAAGTISLADLAADGANDRLYITGGSNNDFLKGAGSAFAFDFKNSGSVGFYKLVDWTGDTTTFVAGDFVATNLFGGNTGSFTVDNTRKALFLEVAAVPEPNTAAQIGLVVLTFSLIRRRRRA